MSVKGQSGSAKNYYGDVAGVVCAGPVDELVALLIDGKTVWPTNRQWADGIFEIPIVGVQRLSNHHSRIYTAWPHALKKNDKLIATGIASPYNTFNCATPTTALAVSDLLVNFINGTTVPVVAQIGVNTGLLTKVVSYYGPGDPDNDQSLVSYAGAIWLCILTHDGTPDKAPPNATYWQSTSVKRTDVSNPFQFSVTDSLVPTNYGTAYFYFGTANQTLRADSFLKSAGHPPYRHQAFIELEKWFFGTERQGPQNIEVVVRKKPIQSIITGDSANLDTDNQANPICAIAEMITDPIFGIGVSTDKIDATSWQDLADALADDTARTYLSPMLDTADTFRSFVANILAYYDGWMRFSASGKIEAGRFSHNEAPPTFTDATTIDYNDLLEEIQWDSDLFASTFNETICKFQDRQRAYKDASQPYVSGYNRNVVGEPRRATLDRPWIVRETQAAAHAAEWGKINAQPFMSGTLEVRTEKCASIKQGDLFLLTHDAVAFSIICRCTEKTRGKPPSGRATIRFQSERGIAPIPYHPTVPSPGGTALPAVEEITLYQFVQPPPPLVTSSDFQVMILAARTSPLTRGLRPWLQVDDADLFYQLGEQRNFGVKGLLSQDYPAPTMASLEEQDILETTGDPILEVGGGSILEVTPPAAKSTSERSRTSNVATLKVALHGYATGLHVNVGNLGGTGYNLSDVTITVIDADHFTYPSAGANEAVTADNDGVITPLNDDDSETLQINVDELTVQADLDKISATQTLDAINDDALLVWLFSAADPTQFEICTLKEIRLDAGVYKLKVRRQRFSTTAKDFVTGDIAFIIFAADLVSYSHGKFGDYAQSGSPATFRLQAFTPNEEADLTNANVCPDIDFTFTDPFAAVVVWDTVYYLVTDVPTRITNFLAFFLPTNIFQASFKITSPSGNLVEAKLIARLDSLEIHLWSQSFSPTASQAKTVQFSIPTDGCWNIFLVAKDASNRVTERSLQVPSEYMGLAPGTIVDGQICIQAATNQPGGPTQQVLRPIARPFAGISTATWASITLFTITAGTTIYWKVLEYGSAQPAKNAPGNGWTVYSGAFRVDFGYGFKAVYAYATKPGYADSPLFYGAYGYGNPFGSAIGSHQPS